MTKEELDYLDQLDTEPEHREEKAPVETEWK